MTSLQGPVDPEFGSYDYSERGGGGAVTKATTFHLACR